MGGIFTMSTQMTLNTLKKCLDNYREHRLTHVEFLKTVLPQHLYTNKLSDKNIPLCDSYENIKNWVSHLMNYQSCTKSGAKRVRHILFDYILTDDILIEIAQNCQSLLPDSPFVSNELLNIIQEDNSLNAEFRSHVTSLLNNNDYYQAFSCCIVYSFFPDNQEKISRFICSSTVLCEQQLPSEKDLDACLTFLQQSFNEFFQHIKNNNFAIDLSNSQLLQKLDECNRVLSYELLRENTSKEFYQDLKKYVNRLETLKMWNMLNPAENKADALNNLGKKLDYIANLETELNNLNDLFYDKKKYLYNNEQINRQ